MISTGRRILCLAVLTTLSLGTYETGSDPKRTILLRARHIPTGKALMNVRRIVLKPV